MAITVTFQKLFSLKLANLHFPPVNKTERVSPKSLGLRGLESAAYSGRIESHETEGKWAVSSKL